MIFYFVTISAEINKEIVIYVILFQATLEVFYGMGYIVGPTIGGFFFSVSLFTILINYCIRLEGTELYFNLKHVCIFINLYTIALETYLLVVCSVYRPTRHAN